MSTSNTKKILSALAVPAVALSILAPSAWGQDALGACLARKDDKERLTCYDAATGRTSRTRVREGDRREEDDERPRRTDDERFRRTDDERPRRTDDERFKRTDDERPRRTDDERFKRTDDERPRRTDDERFRRTDDERPRPRRAEREGPPPADGSGVVEILKANEGAGDLVLRCKDNKTEVAIKLRGFVYYPAEPTRVTYRIDRSAPIEAQWLASADGRALYARSSVQFIKALPDRGKLFVRAYDRDGIAHYSLFELVNVATLRDRLGEACQWDGPPKTAASPPAVAPVEPPPVATEPPVAEPAPAEIPARAEIPVRPDRPKGPPRKIRQD
jgi:hypothetical protein